MVSVSDDGRVRYSCPCLDKKKKKLKPLEHDLMKINEVTFDLDHNLNINIDFNMQISSDKVVNNTLMYSLNPSEHMSRTLFAIDSIVSKNEDVLLSYGGSLGFLRVHRM